MEQLGRPINLDAPGALDVYSDYSLICNVRICVVRELLVLMYIDRFDPRMFYSY